MGFPFTSTVTVFGVTVTQTLRSGSVDEVVEVLVVSAHAAPDGIITAPTPTSPDTTVPAINSRALLICTPWDKQEKSWGWVGSGLVFANGTKGPSSAGNYEGGSVRDLSRRARILLAGGVMGVLGSGLAGAMVIPATAASPSSAATPASTDPLVQVCLTVREINFGPKCVAV